MSTESTPKAESTFTIVFGLKYDSVCDWDSSPFVLGAYETRKGMSIAEGNFATTLRPENWLEASLGSTPTRYRSLQVHYN